MKSSTQSPPILRGRRGFFIPNPIKMKMFSDIYKLSYTSEFFVCIYYVVNKQGSKIFGKTSTLPADPTRSAGFFIAISI